MTIRRIEDKTRIATAGLADDMIIPDRVPPLVYLLISKGAATLRDLREVYTIEDAIDLYEIVLVDAYNQVQAAEASRRKTKGI